MPAESSSATPTILLHADFFLGQDEIAQALLTVFNHEHTLRKRAFGIWLITAMITVALAVTSERWRSPMMIGVAIFCSVVFALLYYRRFAKQTVKASLKAMKVDTDPGIIGQRRVQITPDEILVAGEVTRVASRLDPLTVLRERDFAIVLLPGGMFLPIPREGNFGRETFDTFCDKLQCLIAEAKETRLPQMYTRQH
jgi:hypothetical protein